jgi:hypothetical protein
MHVVRAWTGGPVGDEQPPEWEVYADHGFVKLHRKAGGCQAECGESGRLVSGADFSYDDHVGVCGKGHLPAPTTSGTATLFYQLASYGMLLVRSHVGVQTGTWEELGRLGT